MDIPRLFRIRSAGRFYAGVNHARVRLRAHAGRRGLALPLPSGSSDRELRIPEIFSNNRSLLIILEKGVADV